MFESDRFAVSEGGNQFYDLCLMSMCSDFIIANSSFSWWGAWLIDNPEKKVIAPKKWFGKQYDHYHMDDLIPETWTVL